MEAVPKRTPKTHQQRRHCILEKGFEILQNIQHISTLEKHVKRARDPITTITKNEKPIESIGTTMKLPVRSNSNICDILDVNKQSRYVTLKINNISYGKFQNGKIRNYFDSNFIVFLILSKEMMI